MHAASVTTTLSIALTAALRLTLTAALRVALTAALRLTLTTTLTVALPASPSVHSIPLIHRVGGCLPRDGPSSDLMR